MRHLEYADNMPTAIGMKKAVPSIGVTHALNRGHFLCGKALVATEQDVNVWSRAVLSSLRRVTHRLMGLSIWKCGDIGSSVYTLENIWLTDQTAH